MDSLLASYASSDEDEEPRPPKPAQSISNSLPPPKTSLFNSLPPPKSQSQPLPNPNPNPKRRCEDPDEEEVLDYLKPKPSSSSLFSSMPPPNSKKESSSSSLFSSIPAPNSKRVVQFKPPVIVNPYSSSGVNHEKEDKYEDEEERERERKRDKESVSTSSSMGSLFLMMPAPKHSGTLGSMPLGAGRRSMVETGGLGDSGSVVRGTESEAVEHSNLKDESNERNGVDNGGGDAFVDSGGGYSGDQYSGVSYEYPDRGSGENYAYYGSEGQTGQMSYDYAGGSSGGGYYAGYGSVDVGQEGVGYSYGNDQHVEYGNAGGSYDGGVQYENNWGSAAVLPEASGLVGNGIPLPGKKGRKDVPPEIVEVRQDELMKNRPRQDQVKMTGIAFGPSYQPAPTKGKPSKLHKRKHQISSLYFEMRQKEMELAERRAQGFKTKAETQSKYGW